MSNQKEKLENPMPVVDENWWASVLAEEDRYRVNQPARSLPRPRGGSEARSDAAGSDTSLHWNRAKDLYLRDEIVQLNVTGCNRGGLLVDGDGLSGFVPFSHLLDVPEQVDTGERENCLSAYVGRTLDLKIIECMPEESRIVFSERAAQAGPGKRAELFHSLHSGEHVTGVVTNIADFGVFVDLGGVEGLIHISELSWGRVAHPGQIVEMGQTVQAQVLDLSPERCRVALSLKRLLPNPWTKIGTEHFVGQVLPAVVTSVLSYGAFARIDLGVEGLIHASEMPLPEGQTIRDFLQEGQEVQVRILHVDAARQRIGFSMKLE